MSSSGDDKSGAKPAGEDQSTPGGVQHDSRGNAVWQWAVDTGRHALDSTSRLLKKLEVPGLKLEDDGEPPEKTPGATPRAAPPVRGAGYDPSGGSRGAGKPGTPPPRPAPQRPAVPGKAATKPDATSPNRPSLWRRLFRRD
jgi:hypothetical protein